MGVFPAPSNQANGAASSCLCTHAGLLGQLQLGLGQQGRDIQAARQGPGHLQQGGDIVDIGIDTVPNARILDLDRQHPAVAGHRRLVAVGGAGPLHAGALVSMLTMGAIG